MTINEEIDLRYRLRRTAQILIEEVGADGSMNAEEAARKAVQTIKDLKIELSKLEEKYKGYNQDDEDDDLSDEDDFNYFIDPMDGW